MSNFNDIMIIFCLVLGKGLHFDKLNFGHFQKLVHSEIKYTSRASDLELWKVFIPTEGEDEKLKILQDYAENNSHAEFEIEKQLEGVKLSPSKKIREIFDKGPEDDHIHIIIKRPAEGTPLKRARTEEKGKNSQNKEEPPWSPSPKKQKIKTHGTATIFAGKGSPISLDNFSEILNRGYTIIDKTLLIAEFIDCRSFSIPIYLDNENYHRELFKDTRIMERSDLFDKHFCKYPVIFLSLKGFDGCETWSEMQAQLCQQLATLYEEHKYVYEKLSYSLLNASRFDQIYSGILKDGITKNALFYLSKYLNDYHRSKCIVLIDEYDHPIDVAYRYKYYEEARGLLASLFGALLKGNDENLEKALLVGVFRISKSGYLSRLNNMQVFPMHNQEYADKFGFTEEEVFIILQHYNKSQVEKIKDYTNNLEAHWVDTGGTTTIKKLLWHSTEDFRKKTLTLLQKGAINVEILKDIDYLTLSPHASDVLWTLLYYGGYLTMNKEKKLCIPNTEVFTEWKGWLNNRISSNPDTMLEMLLQCHLTKLDEELPTIIMESLSYFDTTDNLAEKAGVGRFDVRILPNTENVDYPVSIIMEFKRELRKKSEEVIAQIIEKRYRTGIRTTKLVECGIAFKGNRAYVLSRVLRKERDQWAEDEK
ncbi:13139_t:CDS:10 [Funneliformis geosporum]|nr:13139_t:CDS:10 [Funneliformis geosporum]